MQVEESGLLVHNEKPWFAASPDGFVSVTGPDADKGLLEIKCPYPDRKKKIPKDIFELARERDYLDVTKDGDITIYRNSAREHNYFYQMQCQMGIANMKWCDFFVYYKVESQKICESKVIRVRFEPDVFRTIEQKVDEFYLRGVVPELLTRRIHKGKQLYPNPHVYKYKSEPKTGK